MRKFFLIPLMALCSCVMAWGATRTAGTFQQLQDALDAAQAGDVIELTADIAYPDGWATYTGKQPNSTKNEDLYTANPTLTGLEPALCIKKSITLDGKNHRIEGFGKYNINADASTNNHRVTLAVRPDNVSDAIDVTIKNISMGNSAKNFRYYGIITFDGVAKLTCENINITCADFSYQEPLCFTGAATTALNVVIKDSEINAGKSSYPAYILKPITATLENSTFVGYCALYFKYRATGVYGSVAGSRGSVVNAEDCDFNAPNVHSGYSNDFAVFPCEDDGITLNLHNCGMNAQELGNAGQDMVCASEWATRREQDITINISGDNSHINGRFAAYNWSFTFDDTHDEIYENGYWQNWDSKKKEYTPTGYDANMAFTPCTGKINVNITGGTFSLNPAVYTFNTHVTSAEDISAFEQEGLTIPATHEVQTVNQGGVTVYRVVKKVAKDGSGDPLYNLNDYVPVEGEGYGDNPISSFELSDGTNMTLNQEVTTAGYVQIMDGASTPTTVTVAKNADPEHSQTLKINNGLDVQGNSQVVVEATAALVIGEGGIVTSKPENIVIEANENGAASLLLHPEITVNQTPELTVKMAVPAGLNANSENVWHRFAMPVKQMDVAWGKKNDYPTWVYGWDYAANDWALVEERVAGQGASTGLEPWKGYTLSYNETGEEVYTFKGQLLGNTDAALNFAHEGFNFFGNSYTGYIDAKTLVEGLVDSHIDGSIYLWDTEHQVYGSVTLNRLRNDAHLDNFEKEIAPMQTFILQLRGADDAAEAVDYASAIWGNPRYGNNVPVPAPRRQLASASADDAYMQIIITTANGKMDRIILTENANNSDAFESGFDASKFMNANSVNLYSTINGENLSTIATDNLSGKTLTLNTNSEIAYTMSFKHVEGTEYAIRDNATNQVIAIVEGATYGFAAQPNSTVEGRFEIIPVAKMPTAIENTDVKADVKGIYTITGQYVGENFDILPAGVYVVNGVKIVK